jgi:tRNA (cmo5U34)-methyltransferase
VTFQQWDPKTFLARMHETCPDYERLQAETVAASGAGARRILELGTGTGETASRVLARHPHGAYVGVDASGEILDYARHVLPSERVELRVGRLEESLPPGPFDLVVSVLTVHHLRAAAKADLFRRVAGALRPSGRLVVGDFIVHEDPAEPATELDPTYDAPSTIAEQLHWMREAGLSSELAWSHRDLAVMVGSA